MSQFSSIFDYHNRNNKNRNNKNDKNTNNEKNRQKWKNILFEI